MDKYWSAGELSLVVIVVCWVSDSSGIGRGGCGPVTGGDCGLLG